MANSGDLKQLQTLQNKLMKVLLNKKYMFPTNQLHTDLNILKIIDIFNLEILIFVFSQFNNLLPEIFDDYYVTFSSLHNIATRGNTTKFIIPRHYTNMGTWTVKVHGETLWNALSNQLKECSTIKSFRLQYRKSLPY